MFIYFHKVLCADIFYLFIYLYVYKFIYLLILNMQIIFKISYDEYFYHDRISSKVAWLMMFGLFLFDKLLRIPNILGFLTLPMVT